jgi:hypothetical protein
VASLLATAFMVMSHGYAMAVASNDTTKRTLSVDLLFTCYTFKFSQLYTLFLRSSPSEAGSHSRS